LEDKKIDAGLISFSNRIKGEIKEWIKNGKVVNFEKTIILFDETDSMTESVLRVFDTIDSKYIYVTENFINSA
jgi:DNA polymerase III delta prime subunit